MKGLIDIKDFFVSKCRLYRQKLRYKYHIERQYLIKPPFRTFVLFSVLIFLLVLRIIPSSASTIAGFLVSLLPLWWLWIERRDNVPVNMSLGSIISADNDSMRVYPDDYNYAVIKTAGIRKIMESAGYLREIRVVDGPIGEVAVYDGDDENRQEIVPPCSPDKGQVLKKDCMINTGLVIVTASDTKIVISYRQR